MTQPISHRILFVCLGNICRSPTAEGVMRALAPDWEIDSAGTSGWHDGEPPYGPVIKAAAQRGYDLSSLRSRKFTARDYADFDEIIVMDQNNADDVEELRPAGSTTPVRLLLDYAPQQPVRDVPDPYYTRDFETALDLVETACRGMLKAKAD